MPDLELYRPRQVTRWRRMMESLRSLTLGPFNPKDPVIARYFGGGQTLSGVSVSEETATSISAVWSAVTMISDDIASLPLMLYKRLEGGGKDRFEIHPLYRLLHDAPNPEMDSMVLRKTMQAHVLLWQNAYAEIERDGADRPVAIWPLVPESVSLFRDRGVLRYRVRNPSGNDVILPPEDMIHLVGYTHDGSIGSSLVQQARESFGLTLASEKYGASFFGNGATMGGVVSVDGSRPTDQTEKGHREQLESRHQGVERAHKLLLLYNGAKFTSNVVPPNAGQFNETRIHQIREVARWFKMPPHKLGDLADATYSNVEQMDAAYMGSCIRPWLKLWEQQLARKLIAKSEQRQQFIEHDTHGFLSVDAASRAALYQTEANIGTVTINEIRGYENRDPLKGGDRVFIALNRIPLDRYDEWIDVELESKKAKAEADRRPPDPKPDPDAGRAVEILTAERDLARRKAQEYEDKADHVAGELRTALDRVALLETNQASLTTERDLTKAEADRIQNSLAADLEAARQTVRELTAKADQIAGEARAALDRVATVEADAASLKTERDLYSQDLDTLTTERDGLRADVAAGATTRSELTTTLARTEADRDQHLKTIDGLAGDLAQARTHVTALETTLQATETARGVSETARQAAETARIDLMHRLTGAKSASRIVLVDALERVLQREVDRARKHQTTPEKLRAWIENFYPLHADVCRGALRPWAEVWAVLTGVEQGPFLEQLVERHIQESIRGLRLVAEADDLPVVLERTLRRWETERAGLVADAVIREGLTHG